VETKISVMKNILCIGRQADVRCVGKQAAGKLSDMEYII